MGPEDGGNIACPSASLCVTGDNGEILVSNDPLKSVGSAWRSTDGLDDETTSPRRSRLFPCHGPGPGVADGGAGASISCPTS